MAWAKNGTPSTLTGTADVITISDLTAKTFNIILSHEIASGAIYPQLRLNNDGGIKYANRRCANGVINADTLLPNRAFIFEGGAASTTDNFSITHLVSIVGQEKLAIRHTVFSGTTGAGYTPAREELVGKYAPSPDADITRIDEINTAGGDYTTGSNISALGTTGDEVLYKIQNGTVFEETDTNKSFIFNSSTSTWTQF